MSYRDFKLSNFGWIAASFLVLIGYLAYYIWFYPDIAAASFRQSFTSKQDGISDIELNLTSPIYLASYQPSILSLSVRNLSTFRSASGKVIITPILFDSYFVPLPLGVGDNPLQGLMFDGVQKQAHTLVFSDLNAGQSQDFIVKIQLPSDSVSYVIVTTDIVKMDPSGITILNDSMKWEGRGYPWSQLAPLSPCARDEVNYTKRNVQICLEKNSYGIFAESALQKLLLPPFANWLFPFLVFALVWFVEQILPSEWLTGNMHSVWNWIYILVLFLLPTVLIFILAKMTLYMVNHVIDGRLVYFEMLGCILLIAVIIRYAFFLIRSAGWGVVHKDETSTSKEIDSIELAYSNNDLMRLDELRNYYNPQDMRYQRATAYYEQLKGDISIFVDGVDSVDGIIIDGMVSLLKKLDYVGAIQKTYRFWEEGFKSLPYLPDLQAEKLKKLSSFLKITGRGVQQCETGWIFADPEHYEQRIYDALIDKLAKLPAQEWEKNKICDKLEKLIANSKQEKWIDFTGSQEKLEELIRIHCLKPDKTQKNKEE